MRRSILALAFAGTALSAARAWAQEPVAVLRPDDLDGEARRAIDRGLAFLASNQNANGSWTNRVGYKLYDGYFGEEFESVDVTALACMALAAGGHLQGRGRFGRNVERGVSWLLSKSREEDGYITHAGSRMYSHAFATLFLAEIYGMTERPDVKLRLKRAVDLLVHSQNREGGWRYQPIPVDADLSVTVSSLQALRAARNVGVAVPLDTIHRALEYVTRCATPEGFCYQASQDGRSDMRISFALTACGVVALHSAGRYGGKEVREGLQALPRLRLTSRTRHAQFSYGFLHYFYGHYYAAQATYLAGGRDWADYFPSVRAELLQYRVPGKDYWEDDVGRNYATAMACVILQLPAEYLPIFQK